MPELLSPAGSPEALRAAVENGAGAVYLGLGGFNARRSAKNFTWDDLAAAIPWCHERGARIFLTLNTLLSDRELPEALEMAERAAALGVDAVLVQDWGLLTLLREALPSLPLHASTQMSIFTSGGANELARDGCERIVLARECSKEDIRTIIDRCPAEIEIFAHGALCMCYSGQCALSALIGGRSGNRGRCAQPCRMCYGIDAPAAKARPLSLKDCSMAGHLKETEEIGVACLKLEGRMKRAEYVAVVTGIYAKLLAEQRLPTAQEERALEDAFSRSGFTDSYWRGRRGAGMFGARPEGQQDPKELFDTARAAYEKGGMRKVGISMDAVIDADMPARLTVRDDAGNCCTVSGQTPEAARKVPLSEEQVRTQLTKTGGTAYRCDQLSVTLAPGLSLSSGALNALRRDALSALSAARCTVPARARHALAPLPAPIAAPTEPQWTVSLKSLSQLSPDLLRLPIARLLLPLEAITEPLPAFRGAYCAVWPRVWRDRDEPELKKRLARAREYGVSGVYLGNIGALAPTEDCGLDRFGDYGLNIFNGRALDYLAGKGLASATLSFELRGKQIREMQKCLPTETLVYGRLPAMLCENLPHAAAPGQSLRDRTGAAFPIMAAFGGRCEIENSRPLYLADRPELQSLGLHFLRLRFTTETAADCAAIARACLAGEPPRGTFTRGLFERGVE